MKKICYRCHESKDTTCFSRNVKKNDGLAIWCKDCHKQYRAGYYETNKEFERQRNLLNRQNVKEWFEKYKADLSCPCGENHPATLDFHHRDGEDKYSDVTRLVQEGYSKKTILEEIVKCDVLCSNCHRKLHYEKKSLTG